jgi:hypothetical protein
MRVASSTVDRPSGVDGDNQFYDAEINAYIEAKNEEQQQQQAQNQQAQNQNNPTVSVTTDLYTNKAKDQGYAGAQIQLMATVKGDNSVAYNCQQTVTTDNIPAPDHNNPSHKANKPFNDAAPDTHLYWSAKEQKQATNSGRQATCDYNIRRHPTAVWRLSF